MTFKRLTACALLILMWGVAPAYAHLAFLRKITFADGHEIVVWVGDTTQAK